MAKRAEPEEIITKLREVEARLSCGETTGRAVRAIGGATRRFVLIGNESAFVVAPWRKEIDPLRGRSLTICSGKSLGWTFEQALSLSR